MQHFNSSSQSAPTPAPCAPKLALARALPQGGLPSLLGLLLVGGCSQYTPDKMPELFAKAHCNFEFNCCNAQEYRTLTGGNLGGGIGTYSTEDECVEERSKPWRASFRMLRESEAAGRISWDAALAESCFGSVVEASDSCDAEAFIQREAPAEECDDVVIPLVEDGDECFDDGECVDGGNCLTKEEELLLENDGGEPDEITISLRGTCKTPPAAGESCAEFGRCRPDAYCSLPPDPTCKTIPKKGQDCPDGICELGAFCVEDTCQSPPSAGENCRAFGFCDENAICNADNLCEVPEDAEVEIDYDYDICLGE